MYKVMAVATERRSIQTPDFVDDSGSAQRHSYSGSGTHGFHNAGSHRRRSSHRHSSSRVVVSLPPLPEASDTKQGLGKKVLSERKLLRLLDSISDQGSVQEEQVLKSKVGTLIDNGYTIVDSPSLQDAVARLIVGGVDNFSDAVLMDMMGLLLMISNRHALSILKTGLSKHVKKKESVIYALYSLLVQPSNVHAQQFLKRNWGEFTVMLDKVQNRVFLPCLDFVLSAIMGKEEGVEHAAVGSRGVLGLVVFSDSTTVSATNIPVALRPLFQLVFAEILHSGRFKREGDMLLRIISNISVFASVESKLRLSEVLYSGKFGKDVRVYQAVLGQLRIFELIAPDQVLDDSKLMANYEKAQHNIVFNIAMAIRDGRFGRDREGVLAVIHSILALIPDESRSGIFSASTTLSGRDRELVLAFHSSKWTAFVRYSLVHFAILMESETFGCDKEVRSTLLQNLPLFAALGDARFQNDALKYVEKAIRKNAFGTTPSTFVKLLKQLWIFPDYVRLNLQELLVKRLAFSLFGGYVRQRFAAARVQRRMLARAFQ